MKKTTRLVVLSLTSALLMGASCGVEESSYDYEAEDRPYGDEGAGQQTMDEQMREVDEQINR